VIYAYGICEPATASPPPPRRGLGGATLRVLTSDGLAAVYSRHRSLRPRPSPELVLAHERVVEAMMARGPVLPLRFGTQLEAEERLAAALTERGDELLRALERLRGHVELGLRVIQRPGSKPDFDDAGERSGRAYLLARAAHHRRAEEAARDIHAPLADLAAESRLRERAAPPAILVAAYLIDARAEDDLRRRADELAAQHEDLHVVVTGPWPPYNFSTEEPGEDRGRS
jgi:Gas vesicle synthesis protein GvpL/GvpF